jgi:formylglycine-generating enzyme required for sulfatase activity
MGTFQVEPGLNSRVLPTTVSSFYLDKYEVTVGRFRAFLRNYDAWLAAGNPVEGAGAYQWARELGWQTRWQNALLPSAAELGAAVMTCNGAPFSTLGAPELDEDTPVNCVTWHEALAFCIWDDARLPTEAEWMNAATGGDYNRVYPWGNEPPPSPSYAVYDCSRGGELPCTLEDIRVVGSKPLGAGRWKHVDLAGSMAEWVADGGSASPFGGANPTNIEDERLRVLRGGDWTSLAIALQIGQRLFSDPGLRNHLWGIRCARENPGSRL